MRILFDIGHPAHVHYFRNLIQLQKNQGDQIYLLARDKDITLELLEAYKIPYISKGKGGKRFSDRSMYTIRSLRLIENTIRNFKPHLCISHASPYMGMMTALKRIPHIMINDTEGAFLFQHLVKLFKPELYLPDTFEKKISYRHQTLNTYLELAYLHPDLFTPDRNVTDETGENFVLVRFVSESATHDQGRKAVGDDFKKKLVETLSSVKQVWISSEDPLPRELESFRLRVPPEKIHDVIAHASLLVGGSATMSSEAAVLGVPSVLISQNRWGYIHELEEKYGLVHYFRSDVKSQEAAISKAVSILEENNPEKWQAKRAEILKTKRNMTEILMELIQNHKTKKSIKV
ncbi:MAG: DUF354 domain-containing protein [Balneolaceae bacterium]|nr:DUF354 domain-containing protein [Balneolaceae bacterium]